MSRLGLKEFNEDLTGNTYNKLTVLGFKGRLSFNGSSKLVPVWECVCDCGIFVDVRQDSIKTGNTKSCGCLKMESIKTQGHLNKTHGKSKSEGYGSWISIKRRCYSKTDPRYGDYGGRGITVCDRWLERGVGVLNFLEDMGKRPSKTHSIDRIDVNGNYCKENCRWATSSEQNRNKREYKNSSKWGVGIYRKGNSYLSFYSDRYLGSFESPEKAQEIRDAFMSNMEKEDD